MVTGWALYLAPPDKMFRQIVYNVHIFKFYSRDICYEVLIKIHACIMMMHTYVFLEFYIEVYMYLKILFGRMPDCLQCYRPLTSSIFAVVSCLKRFVMPPAL